MAEGNDINQHLFVCLLAGLCKNCKKNKCSQYQQKATNHHHNGQVCSNITLTTHNSETESRADFDRLSIING